ncbi:MAG: tetratricopeptide repeat protein [Chloroflexi bacterium]|nr:tetratricopeptide repeat protein [Chloroflexota bacterium]MCI0797823.1 tetratricopeptide repeat protein [Chloroflexota bacterium]MCI0866696.1 tetratricopeptide repeat protein [Chloroflexota bacterium]MCI0880083.1 tetratricopeptide repeat protein [Chloroflexota bacterium]MCI0896071.1 tetratricopeptide repeat protein [Chloroflexota bacterium]
MHFQAARLRTLFFLIALALFLAGCGGPTDAQGYNSSGVKLFERGQAEEALAQYNEAIGLDSSFAVAYFNRGQTYFALGQPQKAVQDYAEAIRLNPDRAQVRLVYASRAMAYTLLGNDSEAQEDIGRAVELGHDPRLLLRAIDELKKQR